ncbi:hypothetical protein TURU_088131 [Turdus rufiventris]|nr:hypothetical protein TURU_088131 [Turdus rufiventris]
MALEQILRNYELGKGVILMQYVDDLLLAGETQEVVRRESIKLLNFLSLQGLKVSKPKLQFVEEEVKYLGHWISKETKKLDPERVNGILSLRGLRSKRQIRQLLGLFGYCRQWIENFSAKVRFPYQKLTTDGLVKWTQEDEGRLEDLKTDLVTAPVLSLPDVRRPFYLFVATEEGTAYGILTQEWVGRRKPMGCISKLLNPVSRGWPTCLQAVETVALLVEEVNKVTFGAELKVYSPHNIEGVLQQKAEKWITDARLLKYEGILIQSPKLEIEITTLQNPAQFLYGEPAGQLTHDYLKTIEEQTKIRPDIEEEALENRERLFVDGSSRIIDGKRKSGYAIVDGKTLLAFLTAVGDKNRRAVLALELMFAPVLDGAVSTLFGVLMLAGLEFDFISRTRLALLASRALMTHIQLAIDQDIQVPFHGTAFQPLIPQSVHTSRVDLSQVQNPELALVELHMVGDCSALYSNFTTIRTPLHDMFIQLGAGHFVQKDPGRDSFENFSEIQKDDITWLPLINQHTGPSNRDCLGHKAFSYNIKSPVFGAMSGSEPVYCQPITTVTASASVTIAVHSIIHNYNSWVGRFPLYKGYYESDPGPFEDPHVPFDVWYERRNSKMQVIELQDLECEEIIPDNNSE